MADIQVPSLAETTNLFANYPQRQAALANTQAQTAYLQGPETEATRAQAGLATAQSGLVGMQTQKAAFEVQMIKRAMEAMEALPNGQSSDQSNNQQPSDPTETGIASSLNNKFFVNPVGPPGLQQYINATAWVNPAEAQRAEEYRKLLVQGQVAKNQNEANDIFQTSTTLANSNTKHPLQSLLSLTPGSYLNNVGQAINSRQDKSPQEKDEMASNAIQASAKYSHQYTGRELSQAGDEYRDKATGFEVAAPKVGPTAGEKIGLGEWANTPQKVTIDNREATIKPKDLGISGYQDLVGNKSVKFSIPPPNSQSQNNQLTQQGQGSGVKSDKTGQAAALTASGLNPEQADFVTKQPDAFPQVKGNQQLNSTDVHQRQIYMEQRRKLAETANLASTQSQGTLANIQRISGVLNSPGVTLGPGSREYSQLETFFNQWFDSPAGQAPAYQVLSKFLNAEQMNSILKQLHSEGAQVRLGAYESRLIMEQLAANPQMTKEAINQMLKWQASDAGYEYQKAKTAGALIASNKSVENFDTNYSHQFPKQQAVDTTISAFRQPKGQPNYSGAKGKTYTTAQAEDAAQQLGIPSIEFKKQLRAAGAIIQ